LLLLIASPHLNVTKINEKAAEFEIYPLQINHTFVEELRD
jgi:hypothetical protein